jgi:hypothetical protein
VSDTRCVRGVTERWCCGGATGVLHAFAARTHGRRRQQLCHTHPFMPHPLLHACTTTHTHTSYTHTSYTHTHTHAHTHTHTRARAYEHTHTRQPARSSRTL